MSNHKTKPVFKKTELSKVASSMFANADIPTEPAKTMNWGDVDAIYDEVANGIVDIANAFNGAIASLASTKMYEDDTNLIAIVNTFKNDLLEFTNTLCVIKGKKEGYSGDVKDEDELALNIEIFADLHALYDKFRTILQPHLIEVTERIVNINSLINQEKEVQNNVN